MPCPESGLRASRVPGVLDLTQVGCVKEARQEAMENATGDGVAQQLEALPLGRRPSKLLCPKDALHACGLKQLDVPPSGTDPVATFTRSSQAWAH